MGTELRGRALYDFDGDVSQNELCFKAGDEMMVLRQDIGEGWWEGQLKNGKTGLFPETYVEIIDESEEEWEDEHDDWEEHPGRMVPGGESSTDPPAMRGSGGSSSSMPPPSSAALAGSSSPQPPDTFGRAPLKRSINRFSAFVRAGAESYMRGTLKDMVVDGSSQLHVQMTPDGLVWVPNPRPYSSVSVRRAGQRSKYKGITKYEAYDVFGGTPNGAVERRYKHFVWLHDRLREKYSCVCVPPLPDARFFSKYGETFADKRQFKLQQWLVRVCRHPVLSRDELALRHFMACPTSDIKAWKAGKRRAERDEGIGGQFFRLVCQDAACPKSSDKDVDTFHNVVREMTAVVRRSQDVVYSHAERMNTGFRREYKRIADCMRQLSETFSKGVQANGDSVKLSMALFRCAETYDAIAGLWAQQPAQDQIPLYEGLKEYAGMLTLFHDGIGSCREASQKVAEIDAAETAEPGEKEAVRKRRDIIHTLMLCEIAHFHKQRREDFRDLLRAYLTAQIEFYEKITDRLKQARSEFERLPY